MLRTGRSPSRGEPIPRVRQSWSPPGPWKGAMRRLCGWGRAAASRAKQKTTRNHRSVLLSARREAPPAVGARYWIGLGAIAIAASPRRPLSGEALTPAPRDRLPPHDNGGGGSGKKVTWPPADRSRPCGGHALRLRQHLLPSTAVSAQRISGRRRRRGSANREGDVSASPTGGSALPSKRPRPG